MSGVPQYNIPLFDRVAKELRAKGYNVVSPAELDSPEMRKQAMTSERGNIPDGSWTTGETWGSCLARDVLILSDTGIQGIVLLPNWSASRGASLESTVGLLNGLKFFEYDNTVNGLLRPLHRDAVLSFIGQGFRNRWAKA